MDPQEGDIARGPNGETAVFRGGQWVVQAQQPQAAQSQPQIPGFVPFQSPADRRAEEAARRAESSAARMEANDARRVEIEGRTADRQGIQDEIGLKTKFESLPEVREFPVVRDQYEIIKGTASDASPAGDLALVTAYMKMLDPGSVVREQEFANAANAGGAVERAKAVLSDITGNGILTPKQRADFVAQARGIFEVRATTYNGRINEFRGLAEQYGFQPDNIGRPIEIDTAPISANRRPLEQGDTPNSLSAQGYKYDGEKDVWYRDPNGAPPSGGDLAARQAVSDRGVINEDTRYSGRILQGLTLGTIDEITAPIVQGGEMVRNAIRQARGEEIPYTSGQYRDAWLNAYRGDQQAFQERNPLAAGALEAGGAMLAPGAAAGGRYIAAAPSMLSAAGRGAAVGAGYGAAYGAGNAEGGLTERVQGAREGAMTGAALGGGLAAGGRAVGGVVAGAQSRMMTSPRAQQVQTLQNNGVSLTPGQRMGGMAQTAENLAQRAPILGPAIRGARERGVESLNRAVGNRALNPIGEGVPANIGAGGDMVSHVQGRLGAEFDRAYSMVPEFVPDDTLVQGLARIGQSKADLPPAMQQQFDNIIGERLQRLQGAATGQNVGSVRSELNGLAGGYLRSQDPAQQGLGRMLAEVADELDGAVSRANPEAGQILAQAREGYSDYIRLERASTAAGGRPFAPGQLESAVRASDGSVRRGAVGRGEARMQDLSTAARSIMPDQFGNPGTADAVGLGGLGVGMVTEPVTTSAIAGGLAVASTPYLMMGRKVVEKLPVNASRQQVEAALGELDTLAQQDSNVIVLRDEIARRFGGAIPATTQQGERQQRLMTQGQNR